METEKELTMKLLIDTKAKRVLFAETGKDVIDFLFSLLVLPLGSIVDLVEKKNMVGCMGNLYESIENISETYVQPNLDKNFLLKPKSVLATGNIPLLPPNITEPVITTEVQVKYYRCGNTYPSYHNYITTSYGAICPYCASQMCTLMYYVAGKDDTPKETPSKGEGGYVKEVVTYVVTDDLLVTPMSTISTITLLKKFSVVNIGSLDEKIVKIGMGEGLELLKASLHTKAALTKVFLAEKVKLETVQ